MSAQSEAGTLPANGAPTAQLATARTEEPMISVDYVGGSKRYTRQQYDDLTTVLRQNAQDNELRRARGLRVF